MKTVSDPGLSTVNAETGTGFARSFREWWWRKTRPERERRETPAPRPRPSAPRQGGRRSPSRRPCRAQSKGSHAGAPQVDVAAVERLDPVADALHLVEMVR